MKSYTSLTLLALLVACSTGDKVKIHHPLGGFPDEPSTVRAIVSSIDAKLGMMRVNVKTVDGEKRVIGDTVWVDEKTIFWNSGGGPNVRSWEDLTGAEIEVKGWYRDQDRYYADEIDVLSFPANPERLLTPGVTPTPLPGPTPFPRPTP